jgi:hypothetical protein
MNSSLRWCLCSYTGGLAIALGACSSTTPAPAPGTGSGGSGSGGGSGGDASMVGMGMLCPTLTHVVAATKIIVDAAWGMTLGVSAGASAYPIWTLSTYDIGSDNKITGTVITCLSQNPPLPLTMIGQMAVGATGPASVSVQFLAPMWNAIAANPNYKRAVLTGALGGWTIGSSFNTDPAILLAGLKPTSQFAKPDVVWPTSVNSLDLMNDVVDDDNDMHPGVTGTPRTDMGFSAPHTASSGGVAVDKMYFALRTGMILTGTIGPTCDVGSGTVMATHLDNRVVGCEVTGPPAADCNSDQYGYLDSNSIAVQGKPPAAVNQTPVSASGTYEMKQLTTDGGTATCDDVMKAFPAP